MTTTDISSILPSDTTILRHLTVNATKPVDVCLVTMLGEIHLLQVVDGKWAGIRAGQSAIDNYESIVSKAPDTTIHL